MRIIPLTLAQANRLVDQLHRHHRPTQGHRFSLGAEKDGVLVGAVIVGRPVATGFDPYTTAEVTRLVTDGTRNACSMLYQAAARTAKEMGFARIQTYTLASEPGTSLRACGWKDEGEAGGDWSHGHARGQLRLDSFLDGALSTRRTDQPSEGKRRWARTLNP